MRHRATIQAERKASQSMRSGRGSEAAPARKRRTETRQRDPAEGVGVFRPGGARPPSEVMVRFIDQHRGQYGVDRALISFEKALADEPESHRIDVEERAAILEFDGKLSRDQAERLALSSHLST